MALILLIRPIAAASNEQAQGIEQVNKAVTEMDKVVQSNAANAEESASASEEMNAQAASMKCFVDDLVALVDSNGNKANGAPETKVIRLPDPEGNPATPYLTEDIFNGPKSNL